MRPNFLFQPRDFSLKLGGQTKVMGIVNTSPDSFSQDGHSSAKSAERHAQRQIRDGADILDIGGESTRPGSSRIPVAEELNRVIPVIKALAKNAPVPISVDTYKTTVARHALDAGASIVNNIMGVKADRPFLKMIRDYGAGVVLMHIRGTPRTMQKMTQYGDLMQEITKELQDLIEICLEIGIKSDKIVVDPGIGFGKQVEHNLRILNQLERFQKLGQPVLIGTSRKSFIGKVLEKETPHRLLGTAASVAAGIVRGAHIIRVHDVAEMKDVARMTDAILNERALNSHDDRTLCHMVHD